MEQPVLACCPRAQEPNYENVLYLGSFGLWALALSLVLLLTRLLPFRELLNYFRERPLLGVFSFMGFFLFIISLGEKTAV